MTEPPTPSTASLSAQALAGAGLGAAELEKLSGVARAAAAAGAAALRFHHGKLTQIREKGRAGDLVTEADLAAEEAVLAVLARDTPTLGVLAEESGQHSTGSDLQWCVDPLDGTTNYAHSYPCFATSVGLTWRGLPLLGAIEVPALGESYWAAAGLGAWCNADRLAVSGARDLANSLLVTGFAYDRQTQLDTNYSEFCWFTHRSQGVRRDGAAAVDLAFVAAGRLDGYWERGLSPWDLAAGVVLVEEAGGVVSRYDGGPLVLTEGRLIASAPGIHRSLIDGLARCQPMPGASFGAPELDG
ncbi:inositol monophosphatase [Synechococcus sp. CS-1325]|uniref:inositol monophosphatase family protein n=1 Tax=unclassified Synechococcus TaxID=2626047 RepID=UPI000DB57635|nr:MULTISPECIES: inositol monophosphatase family protein [unclassified Synechococcus]PZV03089.1 MAG: inositol monophosphatase [Cyanobium sp.]MCT0199403.1 inositol monophosphatase [Synechococcus sp. CS-1325]MCT0214460.1 inositol monophosphatase [Synechococcus sp. CS-1326]MCT0231774.1 inositol monophosphatase [Synechococcus sp. CS-1324]MCT0233237.1 inositol monophosphatase [Synechococcus sp. CS-1327]